MLRRIVKRVLFGKRKNYRRKKRYYPKQDSLTVNNNRRLNNLEDKVSNLISHLKLTHIRGTDIIVNKTDAKKFDNQFTCRG